MKREKELVVGETYHIFNKSIAEFKIFNHSTDFSRMKNLMRYYQTENMPLRFSRIMELNDVKKNGFYKHLMSISLGKEKLVQIIAYCIMPTHFHLILKQLKLNGISTFIGNICNSFSRYFNIKYKRRGPLWEGKFKNVLVYTDEQLLHLTRYIHLNPVTAYLKNKPEEWTWSSYGEYVLKNSKSMSICEYNKILDIKPASYKKFVEDQISCQRELAKIKELLIEEK